MIHRFIQYSGRLAIPTVVLGELYAWAYQTGNLLDMPLAAT